MERRGWRKVPGEDTTKERFTGLAEKRGAEGVLARGTGGGSNYKAG